MGVDSIHNDERLRRLEAVTDATLSRLDASDLLDELLDRVRDLLAADTAAILLLDPHSRQLVATAAKGLEEEVRRGVRVAVGRGFAGRVAETGSPLILTDFTADDVVNPILVEMGLRSLLGVPILAAGEVLGVLHVGSLRPRTFTTDDVRLLELAADRAGLAGQIRNQKLELATALALQRSLLPSVLPEVPGIELAARYVPGHAFDVGGDWYDVFTLPTGWVGVVIGDVSGHGLASAVVMGRIRSALRAYALITDDPAEALTLLDRKVRHFEAGNLTTAQYAMISPDRSVVRISTAGHPPPVLAVPGGAAVVTVLPADPPLGVGDNRRGRHTTTIELLPGAVLTFYTDGLIERRGELIDLGLGRLTDAVCIDPPDELCAKIMGTVGLDEPTDDVALLVVRRKLF
ncbi:putative methionine-R-sulfoxide reductase with GAF domain [Actinoplanes tereljensis]|uniref:Cyclic diguanylate phosphodiesterase n=1 Tax=Paractinoplanes tereljensis TaxID=571912 RepID=A0A919TSR5_9ACTN|nr:GAF domain-containing SpoIIE family protein phosphatase [Actinoplanes tereljensis]GIF21663.1 cyclic diguanylate phosphodiesterase [Actinoplanes tereljensis]